MSKITEHPKTREQFHAAHVKTWGGVVDILKKIIASDVKPQKTIQPMTMKQDAFKNGFREGIYVPVSVCFACEWSNRMKKKRVPKDDRRWTDTSCEDDCLLETGNEDSNIEDCLDGVYGQFENGLYERDYAKALESAIIIRDLPLNPAHEGGITPEEQS